MSNIEKSGGGPLPEYHTAINPATGQQKAYVVLSPEERAKGFVEPVRLSYVHLRCGTATKMARDLAETYARDPEFYSGTFCASCRTHFQLPEFVWEGTSQQVGTRSSPAASENPADARSDETKEGVRAEGSAQPSPDLDAEFQTWADLTEHESSSYDLQDAFKAGFSRAWLATREGSPPIAPPETR